MTGSLDDQLLRELDNRLQYLRKLEQRKTEITSAIEAQGKLTPELAEKIQRAGTLVEAEDLYLPYRPKRKTRASMAIARGLEPLARTLMAQDAGVQPEREAVAFISPEKEVPDAAAAIQGAKDILAEEMANDATCANRCAGSPCCPARSVPTQRTRTQKRPTGTTTTIRSRWKRSPAIGCWRWIVANGKMP